MKPGPTCFDDGLLEQVGPGFVQTAAVTRMRAFLPGPIARELQAVEVGHKVGLKRRAVGFAYE